MLQKVNFDKKIFPLAALILAVTMLAAVLAGGQVVQASNPAVIQPLTLVERVDCRTTIEQVYWEAAEWPAVNLDPKPALDAVLSPAEIEEMVTDTLAQTVALEQKWGLTITAEMLQSELDRMAANDTYTTTEEVQLVVSAPGVLDNDNDPDGDSLTAVLVTSPPDGQLTLNADGSFTYTPDAGFSGQDTFTYQAFDGMDHSEPVTVTITVEPGPPAEEYFIFLPAVFKQ